MMPSDMRLQCPSEDTPPSTRPPSVASSAASTSGTPHRSTSMDSLHTNSSSDKPMGEEYIPTRLIRASPKANANALQFIKTGPALLHKSAKEQMKKAEVVKSLRKTSLQEEEEWQSTQSSSDPNPAFDDGSDWQSNLDKWKSSRRKRNEDVLERVIEVKKFEQQDEFENSRGRRKSKTFNEMREDKNRRGRRYNLVVHDDDNNDLSELGLNASKNGSSLSDAPDEPESTRNADAKSDAGFCTGSDTGSDGVFAEDSISDTSSALGDKREIHDSLESGVSSMPKDSRDIITNGHHTAVTMTTTMKSSSNMEGEYTYAKAIEDYKQFAENSAKKRTSSVSSTASGGPKDDDRPGSATGSRKIEDRLSFFDGLEKVSPSAAEPRYLRRERASAKVDLDKRRSMFELRDFDQPLQQEGNKRRSVDISSTSLRHKVASFENVSEASSRARSGGALPPRDTRFKEKLASFSLKEKGLGTATPRKKTPERDQNFYQKLQSFSRMENGEGEVSPSDKKSSQEWKSASMPRSSPDRKVPSWSSGTSAPAPLKDRIASFENLSPTVDTYSRRKELSVSMENLHHNRTSSSATEGVRTLHGSQSVSSLFPFRRTPSTPFMVVELDEEERLEEQPCVKTDVTTVAASRDYEMKPAKADAPEMKELKPLSVSCENVIEAASQQELPQVPPPRVPESPQLRVPDMLPSTVMETSNHQASSLVTPSSKKSEFQEPTNIAKIPRKLPELPNVTRAQDIVSPKPYHRSEVPDNTLSTVPDNALSTVPDTTFSKVPDTTFSKVPDDTFSKVPDDTLSRVPDDTLSRVPDGTLSRVPDATLSRVPDTNLSQIPDTSVAQVPDTSLPKMPESSLPKMSDVMPPPVPPPRVPTIEDPHSARVGLCLENSSLGSSSPKREADEGEGCRAKDVPRKTGIASTNLEYGDKDIDEVIDTYEHLSEAITIGDGQAYLSTPPQQSLEENLYERIAEDEPVYENIYEKVPDDSETTSGAEGSLEHQYQTLEEVNAEKANLSPPPPVSPTLPPKSKTLSVFEVLDVTWTEDGSSAPAAPPSEPPPPPPPEEEGGEEELEGPIQGGESSPASIAPSAPPVENEGRCDKAATSSPQLPKHSLRQQMSDFLGTKPYVEEEVNLQPPPDVSELLRKEREAERLIVQRQASLTRESSLPDSDISSGSMAPFGRPRYTWEDRMKADGPKSKVDLDESSDHLEFQTPVEKQTSSLHAFNTYQNYVSRFSAQPFIAHNIHNNNNTYQTFRTVSLPHQSPSFNPLDSSPKFKSCESLSTFPSRGCEEEDFLPEEGRHIRKAQSTSSLNSNQETFLDYGRSHRTGMKRTVSSSSATSLSCEPSVGVETNYLPPHPIRKAESTFSLGHQQGRLYSSSWTRSLESIDIDSNGCIQKTKRSFLYILPKVNKNGKSALCDNDAIANRSASEEHSFQTSSPDAPQQPWAKQNSLLVSSTPPPSPTIVSSSPIHQQCEQALAQFSTHSSSCGIVKNLHNTIDSLLHPCSISSNTKEIKIPLQTQHSLPLYTTNTTASFMHEDQHPFVECTSNPSSHAYIFGALNPSSKYSTSRSLQELASILALEENIVELKKKKLAELEQEMEKHDRHMLQRIKGPTTSTHVSQSAPRERVSSPPQYSDKQVVGESPVPAFPELPTTAPTPTVTPPKLPPAPQPMTNTPPSVSTTAGLPIQEFYTAPSFPKYEIENTAATTVESSSPSISTNIGFSARSKPVHENTFTEPATMTRAVETNRVERPDNAASKGTQHAPPPLPRKSILALSAIPKPRLTDNDSWIMKKKEANKKDYSKHWLIQEAEQRRLEQQDRISRPSQLPLSKPTNSFQGTPGYQNHFQNIKSSFHNTSPTAYNNSTSFSSSSSSSSSIAANRPGIVYHNGPNPSSMYPANDSSNKYISNTRSSTLPSSNNINNTYNNNNSWKKQTKTYQPPQPSPPAGSNKPLPDAIINTITQRVNNKNKMNGSARPTIYSSVNAATTTTAYRADDSYHDYMNTDSFSTVHNNIPLGLPHVIPQGSQQQGLGTVPHLPVGNQPPGLANEDQRLLSVSGKKKCSHCGEELGRGAAMIIESLRLFYHIPCFKCCVCNTQLGNGTSGADVRVRNHKLHCHNCYSNDEGMKFSKV